MPAGKTTFNSSLLDAKDSNGDELKKWCKKVSDNFTYTYLYFSPKELSCANMGKDALLQHATMENIGRRLLPQNLNAHSISKTKLKRKLSKQRSQG